jgi:branched-subunit amino acid transport protein
MTTWVAMLCVGLGSYLLRLSPLLLARRVRWPERADRALQHAGRAALVHLVVTSVLGAAATGPAAVVGLAAGTASPR